MALSNAERQKRHRQKIYSLARSATTAGPISLLLAAIRLEAAAYVAEMRIDLLDDDEDPTGERRAEIEALSASLEDNPPSQEEIEREFYSMVEDFVMRRRKVLFPAKRSKRRKLLRDE